MEKIFPYRFVVCEDGRIKTMKLQIGDCVFVKSIGRAGIIAHIDADDKIVRVKIKVNTHFHYFEYRSKLIKISDAKLEHQTRLEIAGNSPTL